MGSKSSKAAAEPASDAVPPASVENIVQSSQPHEENVENDDTAGEPSHEKPAVSPEQAPLSDIEMIVQSGLHEGEEQAEGGPASKSLSGAIPSQHGLSIQQAVQELKEKFSINAPMESDGQDSLGQIRKEMDAYGVPLPIASIEATTIRKRSASLKSNGSSSSSDSDTESDGSSSSSGSSLGFGVKRGVKRKANGDEVEEAEGSDDDFDEDGDLLPGKKGGAKGKITMSEAAALFATPNEVLEPQIAAVAVQELPATARLDLLGTIQSIIDNVIVIQASIAELGNSDKGVNQILDEGSLVCTSDGKVVAPIFETFGAVTTPLYSLRLQTGSPFLSSLKAGERVYFCPEPTFSSLLYTRDIQKQSAKASDASNLYDEEPNDGEVEFSDDEAEQEYKRLAKVERRNRRDRIAWEKEQGANEGDVGAAEAEFEFDEDDMEGDDDIPEQEASESTKEQGVAQQPTKMDLEDGEERSESASVRSQGSPRNKVRRLSQGSENRGFVSQRGRDNARGAGRGRGGRGAPRGRGGRQDGPSQRGGRGGDRDRGRGRGRGTFDTTGGRGSSFDNRGRGRGRESQQPDRYRNRSPTRSTMDGPYQPVRHTLPSRPHFQHPDALPYDGPSLPPSGPPQPPRSPASSLPSRPVSNLPQRAQISATSYSSHSNNASAGRPELSQNGYSHGQGQDARTEAYNPSSPSTSHFNGNMRATHGPLALLQNLQSNPFLTGMQFPMQMNPMAQPYSPVSMVQQQFRPPPSVQPRQFPPTQAPFLARAEAAVATPTSVKRNKTWVNPQSKAGQTSAPQQTVSATPAPYQQVSVPPATTYVPHPTYAPAHMQGLNAPSGYNPAFGQNMAGQHAGRHSDNTIYNNRQGGHYQPPSRSQNVNEYEVRTQPRPH